MKDENGCGMLGDGKLIMENACPSLAPIAIGGEGGED